MAADQSDPMIDGEEDAGGRSGMIVAAVSIALLILFGLLSWNLAFLMMAVVVISIVLWQACDPFAEAAQWIGTQFRIPGSVRGATLDAIASSIPELFTGIFFVLVAIRASQGDGSSAEAAGAEGYGSTIATCAGSAIYNMILIPAIVAITIAFKRKNRPTVDVEDEVLARDGVWFLVCEMVLLGFLFQDTMHWWMGVAFLIMYVVYVFQLYRDTQTYRKRLHAVQTYYETNDLDESVEVVVTKLQTGGTKVHALMVEKVRDSVESGDDVDDIEDSEEAPDTASAFFGLFDIRLNKVSAWLVILVSTAIAAVACYYLVEVTRDTALHLGVPMFFVAVILAAAASSVPDTFLSVGSAMRGDDSGAVSNAFGSNIFDICICLSIPLLINSAMIGWAPIELTQDGEPIQGLVGLRILLWVLTAVTLAIMWHKRQLTLKKALVLCVLYLVFVGYAVLGSLGIMNL